MHVQAMGARFVAANVCALLWERKTAVFAFILASQNEPSACLLDALLGA